jgi:FdhD protein
VTAKSPPLRRVAVQRIVPGATAEPCERTLLVETAVAISVCGLGYAVMMATPSDLEDFALGFALSERLVDRQEDVVGIEVLPGNGGLLLGIEVAPELRDRVFERVRHRVGEAGCGLCGIENLDQALRPLPVVGAPAAMDHAALFDALAGLARRQPLNRETGCAHAAAFCDADGALVAVREDVGRHNAFDKLIGHCIANGIEMAGGFVLLTSRCSYELVEKAALAGVTLLVTVSVPTSLAVERARAAKLTLVSLARADSMLAVSDPYGRFTSLPRSGGE